MNPIKITLITIAGILVLALIISLIARARSGRAGGGGGGRGFWGSIAYGWRAIFPARVPGATHNPWWCCSDVWKRVWFTLLTILAIICIITAIKGVQAVPQGALTLWGFSLTHLALSLGLAFLILAGLFYHYGNPPPAIKVIFGRICLVASGILLSIWFWQTFGASWYNQITASPKKGGGLVPFLDRHHVAVIVIASVLFLIALLSKGFRKFAAVAAIVVLIGWFAVWGVKTIAAAVGNGSAEADSPLITTVPGSMQITVGTKGFTKIGFPDGYNWGHAFFSAQGEGYARPVTIIAVKKGVRNVYKPKDGPILQGLPVGLEPLYIKAVPPADIEGNPTFILTVVTFKVPRERR